MCFIDLNIIQKGLDCSSIDHKMPSIFPNNEYSISTKDKTIGFTFSKQDKNKAEIIYIRILHLRGKKMIGDNFQEQIDKKGKIV